MKRQRCPLRFYDRCPRIENADDSLEFQAGRVKLMPERGRRKGMLLGPWGQFMWRVEAALPASGLCMLLYIVSNVNKAGFPLRFGISNHPSRMTTLMGC